jgi:hypothetical protein
MQPDLRQSIEKELEYAARARADGNEGRARVCARRAAGLAGRIYLSQHGVRLGNTSALEVLKILAETPSLPPEMRIAAERLTLRVNEEFSLPPDIDLLAEAKTLIGGLQ